MSLGPVAAHGVANQLGNMRHISELTPKEGAGLWNAVMPAGAKPFIGNAYHYNADDDTPERVVFMSGVERLGVYFTGKVWADSDLQPVELDQVKVRQYLEGIGISYPEFRINSENSE
jgi:hypothetical protein